MAVEEALLEATWLVQLSEPDALSSHHAGLQCYLNT